MRLSIAPSVEAGLPRVTVTAFLGGETHSVAYAPSSARKLAHELNEAATIAEHEAAITRLSWPDDQRA